MNYISEDNNTDKSIHSYLTIFSFVYHKTNVNAIYFPHKPFNEPLRPH